jgi:hypothetical protein
MAAFADIVVTFAHGASFQLALVTHRHLVFREQKDSSVAIVAPGYHHICVGKIAKSCVILAKFRESAKTSTFEMDDSRAKSPDTSAILDLHKYRMYPWVVDVFNPDHDDVALMGSLRQCMCFSKHEEAVKHVETVNRVGSHLIYQIRKNQAYDESSDLIAQPNNKDAIDTKYYQLTSK